MKYEEILTRFPRPRDGLILVYLMAKSVDGEVITTYQQIAKDTDYSIKQVRSSLANLETLGQTKGRVRAGLGVSIIICDTDNCKTKKTTQGRPRADLGQGMVLQSNNKKERQLSRPIIIPMLLVFIAVRHPYFLKVRT